MARARVRSTLAMLPKVPLGAVRTAGARDERRDEEPEQPEQGEGSLAAAVTVQSVPAMLLASFLSLVGLVAAEASPGSGPVIPKPSKTCGGAGVVKGWCMQDAPLAREQPPPGNYTDAQCVAICSAQPIQ